MKRKLTYIALYFLLGAAGYVYALESVQTEFMQSLEEERVRLVEEALLLQEAIENEDTMSMLDSKIAIYAIMENMLKEKRILFANHLATIKQRYQTIKQKGGNEILSEKLHDEIKKYEGYIDKVSGHVEDYGFYQHQLQQARELLGMEPVSEDDLKKEKEEITEEIRVLLAREKNLYDRGGNPSDIYAVKRSIDILKDEYMYICHELGMSESECQKEYAKSIEEVEQSLDKDSFTELKKPNQYWYRFNERVAKRVYRHKRASDYPNNVRRMVKEDHLKIDLSIDPAKDEKNRPGKVIEE